MKFNNKVLKSCVIINILIILTTILVLIFNCGVTTKKVSGITQSETIQIQTNLKNWGYYSGEITGSYDWATKQAVIKFQQSNGLNPTGAIDGATAQALGIYMSTQANYDLYLLAKIIHAEARGEPYVGKVAVGAVILNRVNSPDFPNTIYGVIYQPWAFTAVHDGQIDLEPDPESYQAAQDALSGWDPTYGCIYYYNPSVATSSWIFNRKVVTTIGNHVFAI